MTNDYGNLELHTVLLDAMKDIDRICRENGLRYYIYAGTLLGAINHKGFIPWDDDIDMVMFPEELRRLFQIIKEQYADKYEISSFDNDRMNYSKMNKLLIKGTEVIHQHGEQSKPIFVDISALHSIPDRRWQRWYQRKRIEIINLILNVQSGEVKPTSIAARFTIGNLARINKNFWGRRLDRIMEKFDNKNTLCVGIMCNTLCKNPYTGATGYDNDITPREWHEKPVYIPFEDTEVMVFSNYEQDLSRRYGPNWAAPYPEEKRVTKHDVKSYSISPEVRQRVGL